MSDERTGLVAIVDAMDTFLARYEAEERSWQSYPCAGKDAAPCLATGAFETCDRAKHRFCPKIAAEAKLERARRDRENDDRLAIERGVPKRCMRVLDSADLRETRARSAAQEWVTGRLSKTEPRCFLVLAGGKGCGKTLAAAELARLHYGTFVDVGHVVRVGQYDAEPLKALQEDPFLVIDDLGCEYVDAKGYFHATFDGLINARYANERATVITTNLPAKAFAERYGERVADRLREAGKYVEITDLSLRGRA